MTNKTGPQYEIDCRVLVVSAGQKGTIVSIRFDNDGLGWYMIAKDDGTANHEYRPYQLILQP